MNLACFTREYNVCTAGAFELWTEEWLGRRYEVGPNEEAYEQNLTFYITGDVHGYEIKQLEEFMNGEDHLFLARVILNYACKDTLLLPGHYMIEV